MSGECCLVTGATGFIGAHLVRGLVRERYGVRCLVRATSDTSGLEGQEGVELAVGELSDGDSLERAVRGCRFVLHCAAQVSDWATVGEIKRANVEGTRKVLEASAVASVERFVYFSTTDVYGHPGDHAIEESYVPGRFSNWYSETKLQAEAEVRRAERADGLPATILRPATVYGPGSKDVVGEMARAIRGGNMLLIDWGRARAGLSYVENVVDAALLALRHEAAPGQAFNVTDGLEVSWREFLDDLAAGLGCRPPRWSLPYGAAHALALGLEHGYRLLRRTTGLTTPPLLSRQAVEVLGKPQDFSNAKARERLGWEPRRSYADGLAATLAWLTD